MTPAGIRGDWSTLERLWEQVVGSETTFAASSGGFCVQKEHSGSGAAPIAGGADEVAVYVKRGTLGEEVGRWPLEEVR